MAATGENMAKPPILTPDRRFLACQYVNILPILRERLANIQYQYLQSLNSIFLREETLRERGRATTAAFWHLIIDRIDATREAHLDPQQPDRCVRGVRPECVVRLCPMGRCNQSINQSPRPGTSGLRRHRCPRRGTMRVSRDATPDAVARATQTANRACTRHLGPRTPSTHNLTLALTLTLTGGPLPRSRRRGRQGRRCSRPPSPRGCSA